MSWKQPFRLPLCGLATVLIFSVPSGLAQVFGGRSVEALGCASAVGGDVRDSTITTVCGYTAEQVKGLINDALALVTDRIVDVSKRLGVTEDAALTLLRIIGQGDVPHERLPQKLAEVANQYKKLEEQVAALNPENPLARGFVEQAQAEIKVIYNFDRAHAAAEKMIIPGGMSDESL